MFLTPLLDWAGRRLRRAHARPVTQPPVSTALPDVLEIAPHAIIAGFGRVGTLVGDMLEQHKLTFVALDTDPDLVAKGAQATPSGICGQRHRRAGA